MELVKFWKGNLLNYNAILQKDKSTIYFIKDVKKIFVGDIEVSNNNQDRVDEQGVGVIHIEDLSKWLNVDGGTTPDGVAGIDYDYDGGEAIHDIDVTLRTRSPYSTTSMALNYSGDIEVNWGDGVVEVLSDNTPLTHTYESSNDYICTIDVLENGNINSVEAMFKNNTELVKVNTKFGKNLNNIKTLLYIFENASNLEIIPLGLFDVCTSVNGWHNKIFANTSIHRIPVGLFDNQVNISSITDCFMDCKNLKVIPPRLFDNMKSLSNISSTFKNCTSLETIDSNLCNNLNNLKNCFGLFTGCTKLKNVSSNIINNCNNINNLNDIFSGCVNIVEIKDNTFNGCASGTELKNVFKDCEKLTSISDRFLVTDTTSFKSIKDMCRGCHSLTEAPLNFIKNITCTDADAINSLFMDCKSLKRLTPNLFDNFSNVTSLESVCFGCESLESLEDGLLDNLTNVTNLNACFNGCSSLTELPNNLLNNCTEVTNFNNCFSRCHNILQYQDGFLDSCTKITDMVNFVGHNYNLRNGYNLTSDNEPKLWERPGDTGYVKVTNYAGFANNASEVFRATVPSAWGGLARTYGFLEEENNTNVLYVTNYGDDVRTIQNGVKLVIVDDFPDYDIEKQSIITIFEEDSEFIYMKFEILDL